MNRLIWPLLAAMLLMAPAVMAQAVGGAVRTTAPTYVNGDTRPLSLDTSGNLRVISTPAGGSANSTQGSTTAGQMNTLVACATLAAAPTYTTATTNPFSCDTNGSQRVFIAPSATASAAIVPTVTSAVASALVVKASAGNLYEWRVTAGASAGYVLLFNATTAPADGAVTPVDCVAVAANATVGSGTTVPERYSTGITIVFSTTGCFTKTASATAFMRARAQ